MQNESGGSWALRILILALRAVRWAIVLVVLLFLLAPMLLDYVGAKKGNAAMDFMYAGRSYVMTTVGTKVHGVLPTKFAGKDRTDWVLIVGLLVLSGFLGSINTRMESALQQQAVRRETERWKSEFHLPAQSSIAADLDAKVKSLQSGKTIDRQELLSIFAETKRKLDALARDLTFLAVDVVGSTKMKDSEEQAAVQHDFHEYRKLVERIFNKHHVCKAAWTPDGVMACFNTIDDAVQAGKDIITELATFNRSVKLIRTDFSVRCGVNSGRVYFDDGTPLESMSDRAIDIAGHMQKYADPNTIAIARTIVEPLRDVGGFTPASKVVDGYEVYYWSPGPC